MGGQAIVQGVTAGLDVAKGIKGFADAEQAKKQNKNAGTESDAKREQLSLRQEATYRTDREALHNAISSYYAKQGWKMPEALPGYGTTRPLPGDAPLYPGYDINPSEWTHKKIDTGAAVAAPPPVVAPPQVDTAPVLGSAVLQGGPAPVTNMAPMPQQIIDDPLRAVTSRVGARYA